MSTDTSDETAQSAPSLPFELKSMLHGHQQWLCSVLDLVATEARRAGLSMAVMLGLGGLLIVTGSSVWILACATAVAAAVTAGATWTSSLLTATLLNALLVAGILFVIIRLSRNLGFAASRAVLRPSSEPDAGPATSDDRFNAEAV